MNMISRRQLLQTLSSGFGYMAFAGLCASQARADYSNPLEPKKTHFPAKAKRVIFACMRGGPSHVDTFDYKPALTKDDGEEAPGQKGRKLMPSPWKFTQHGSSGQWISELFPHVAKHADQMCIVNSMWTDVPNHPQAFMMLHTGEFRFTRPCVGSWVLYGLGTENQNLPGFVTISPPTNLGGAQNYSSGFLPAIYQGTAIGREGQKVADAGIGNITSRHLPGGLQREQLDLVQSLNRDLLDRKRVNAELEGVIESYELAFRMQDALPDVLDLKEETQATLDAYGIGSGATDNFGRQCLMARRLAEAGVRYIEVSHGNWDQHNNLKNAHANNSRAVDQPLGALLADLQARDMLKDTIVMWGGEFGRTPHVKQKDGRDHNGTAYSMWLAGGGFKGGLRYGQSDDHGIKAVEDKVHPHDLHATLLHQLGLDHEKLTYRYGGRDYKLTGVGGA
ncbi:MAG TPA: DUF1501 domain-containing protein, partial [Pirellulaceae bacterium]|nr:DUF1501 domain-containing protein [Pirellulaceae bacterium]